MLELTKTLEVDLDAMSANQVLDRLIQLRTIKAALEAADAKVLDRLDELADAGEIDLGGFSHNDWQFSWSAGKAAYNYPHLIKLEEELKAAKDAAKAAGTATKTLGNSFWTIKPPRP